jgi:dephospho-CoA kinase
MAMAIAIAGKIGRSRASFGDYVRSVARARGLPQTRTSLQELGTLLLRGNPHEFCKAVLTAAPWLAGESLIIDGLRHAETIPILRDLVSPAALKVVLISISENTRLKRLTERGEGDAKTIAAVEEHSSEQQVGSALAGLADLVVSGEKTSDAIVSDLTGWIRNQQCDG